MRCNWSTKANSLLRGLTRTDPRGSFYFRASSSTTSLNKLSPTSPRIDTFTRGNGRLVTQFRSFGQTFTKTAPTTTRQQRLPRSPPLTDAQTSRAAAKAVRMSLRGGEIADAYYIVNSLQSSVHPDLKPLQKIPIVRSLPHRPFLPLDFGRPISSRLAAHSLVHGLLRVGLTMKAYKLIEEMMQSGIKVRPRSLDAVMHSLIVEGATPPGPVTSRRLAHITRILPTSRVLECNPRLVADQSTRYAIRLIMRTRHHRHRCTAEAYYSIIRYCITRGEILIASLLVYMLVSDYQLKQTMASRLRGQIQSVETDECDESEQKAALQSRLKNLIWEKGVIDKNTIFSLMASIQQSMLRDPQQETDDNYLCVSLQALANIAMLLDERRIPFPEVTAIIRALYLCPKTQAKVWILRNGNPVCVEAYSYFHDVLYRLACDPPSIKFPRKLHRFDEDPKTSLPPLDLTAYNTLLHYALRHRLDLALANKLLRHMRKLPKPLEPDVVTYNILLRSGTLLRRFDVAEHSLVSLRGRAENAQHGIMVTDDTPCPSQAVDYFEPALSGIPLFRSEFSAVLRHLQKDKLVLSDEPSPPPNPLTADGYTLSSYILHLTSTGRPHVVADILFHVLPELAAIDHPSWGSMTREECSNLWSLRKKSRRERLHRAASLGPDFFVAVLNALCKAGKTGLAERVWLLTKQAERVSWVAGDIPPWFLPVHAYTIMMQCYAAEATKGLAMRRTGHGRIHEDQQRDWLPLSKEHVRGWAKFIFSSQSSRDIPRRFAARLMGKQLFNSMINGGREVFQSLIRLKKQGHLDLSAPQPDARFFNATIALFTCNSSTKTRRARVSRSAFKRKLKTAHMGYARTGALSQHWHPNIQTIAEQMVECGYSVPLGLRPLFIGRWTAGTISRGQHQRLDMRPFAFPRRVHDTFRPYRVSVAKERGLPIRGRGRKRRRNHTGHERTSTDTTKL